MLFIICVLVLSIPPVQTALGNYATKRLNEDFGTNINIDKIGMQLNGDVQIKKIYIEDFKQDTLIAIDELNTSIISLKKIFNNKLTFGDIDIQGLVFNIRTYKGYKDTNLDVFVAKFEDDNPRKEKSDFLMSSSDVNINDGIFRISDDNNPDSKGLELDDLHINATNFLIKGSDVSARINKLALKDSRGLAVKNMMTNFEYTLTGMTFDDLEIETPRSIIKGYLKFTYDRKDLQYFVDKVKIDAQLRDSKIQLDELNTFYNEFGRDQYARLDVDISGTLNDLDVNKLDLVSRNTRIRGDINFKNVFSKEKGGFEMDAQFSNLTSTYWDLDAIMPNVLGKVIPTAFENLGKFKITGTSNVTASTVDADININTDLGLVDANLKINKVNDIDNAGYKGTLKFDQFDFGTFLNDPKVGKASLDFDVDGKGFVAEKINTAVKGDIYNIEYNNYNYSSIKVAGNVRNKIFDGNLIANDKNLILNFTGFVDFSEKVNKYDFEAEVSYADLKALNFVKKDDISILKSSVKMNMNASGYDDAYGKIVFKNTSYKNQNDTYVFDNLTLESKFVDGTRFIDILSPDIIDGHMEGKFKFRDLKKLFENSIGYIYTNYKPNKVETNQHIDFNFKIYNKIIEVIYPELSLGKNTFIRGRVDSDEKKFRLTFKSPEITFQKNFANNIELQVDNSNPLFNTYLEIDSLNTKYYEVSKFNLINVTVNDTLFVRSEFTGGKQNNDKFNLSLYHTINKDNESVVGFKKSDITIKNNKWYINEDKNQNNKVSFDKGLTTFNIDKFRINHQNEIIRLSGFVKDSTQKDIKLNFTDVDLAKITPDIDSLSLAGKVNGKLDILQKNGSYLPNSSVVIDDFEVNDFMLGSFDASIKGNEDLTNYTVDAFIKNDTAKSFNAKGNISVQGKSSKIDVSLNFNKFNLKPLNPLLQDVLNKIRGQVTGKVDVVGDLSKPGFDGDLTLENAGLGIPYLNVDYDFEQKSSVTLKDQTFIFNSIGITDTKYKSKGIFKGRLSHENFSNWSLDLDIQTDRLLVLDTQESDEALYYGTGFIGGEATLEGPTEALVISVEGATKAGTVFKIPLKDTESFGDNSYIHFITPEEKSAREKGEEIVFNEIKGLELDFDLDITEDAEVEIIINKDTGHSLKGRGRGGILVEINTNGKFDMWGDFSVFEGVYNFAYGGLVQKEFTVQPGGTIAWNGDPLDAQINMKAVYKTQANPSPLLDNPVNRSIPVELIIELTGNLEQPEPTFNFDFPNVNSAIKSELQYRLGTDENISNQALYFLASGGSFQGRGFNDISLSGTIAERLNGIIGGIFSSKNGKFNMNPYFEAGQNTADYQTDNRVGFTLQTQISDRVLINGKVGVPVGGAGATETVVAGDVEINFLLNKEGTLTARVFNRENSIRNFGENIGYTQGIGLSYNVDFDTFKELLRNIVKKNTKAKEDTKEQPVETEEKVIPDVSPASQI
ncbi:translocation/assembly module TamB domain-containing protein [Gaetbulibacter aestuarii]|uniref:Translocation/assembly module TamB domain-containing protein n=1 Tax=Gaetbulibacter aestuarii TaxID=1502358 RepID=A0ABW7MZE8_9FLAO